MINPVEKACPILLRRRNGALQVLAFRHPLAGFQLVKGTLEPGEEPAAAALRELAEESGITQASILTGLGNLDIPEVGQHWHIFLCRAAVPLPDTWPFFTQDGGGLIFDFFWHTLEMEPDSQWHPVFRTALAYVRFQVRARDMHLSI